MLNYILKSLQFSIDYDHIKSHIMRSNPHKAGSPRDALTHGITNFEAILWSTESIKIPLELLSNLPQIGYGLHQGNLNKYIGKFKDGQIPPAIVICFYEDGRIGLLDGSHRVMAALQAGVNELPAYIGIDPELLDILLKDQ